jgi:hypothetical protein
MTKIDRLLDLLRAGHSVTRATALVTLKLANPTAAIATLRSRGYNIRTETRDDGSSDGTTYTRWTLIGRTRRPSAARLIADYRATRARNRTPVAA